MAGATAMAVAATAMVVAATVDGAVIAVATGAATAMAEASRTGELR